MHALRRLLSARVTPDWSAAAVVQTVMTTVGVVTFLAGVLYLPTLAPTRVEMFLLLLGLASVALLCTAVGQLAVVVERLDARAKSPPP